MELYSTVTIKCAASEKRSLETILALRETYVQQARVILARVATITSLPADATVVDIGAAQGMFVLACNKLGYKAIGVEPFEPARDLAKRVAELEGTPIDIFAGTAEALPLSDRCADVVHARSVIEHVVDAQRSFEEAFRVLRPGGVLWFGAASSMCPVQCEITRFPLFGWYPNFLKLKIMRWCNEYHPELIGHGIPATHWFTPWKANKMLRSAGFSKVYDRWDLRLPNEGGQKYRLVLAAIKRWPGAKFIADVLVPGCSYAAVKN